MAVRRKNPKPPKKNGKRAKKPPKARKPPPNPNPLRLRAFPFIPPDPKRSVIRGAISKTLTAFLDTITARPNLRPYKLPPPNCYFDYIETGRFMRAPPANRAAIRGHLIAAFAIGQEANEANPEYQWTHVLLCPKNPLLIQDVFPRRPGAGPFPPAMEGPRLRINSNPHLRPWSDNGPIYYVVLAERMRRGTAREYQRIYLRRHRGVEI